ncbi:MAG: phage portal protein [Rubripirellula sp.]
MANASLSWSIDCSSSVPSASVDVGQPEVTADGLTVTRGWEAARTDRVNADHWKGANGDPIDHDLAFDLPTLRARAVHEYENNPNVEGVVGTHAVDLVGPDGPQLEVRSDNDAYNDRQESLWREWSELCDYNCEMGLPEIMGLWTRQIWTHGALLGQDATADPGTPGYDFPAKFRIHAISSDRLETPWHMHGNPDIAFGVKRTRSGRAEEYFISQPRHHGAWQIETGEFARIPARNIYHGFVKHFPDQTCGYPLLSSALPMIGELRDFDRSVLDAARMAADESGWFINLNPDGPKFVNTDPATGEDRGSFEVKHKRMTTRAAPPGWDRRNNEATHPMAEYVGFRKERMAEIGRAASIPLMLIRLDSSGHNYSSARFDHEYYIRHLQMWQSWMARRFLTPMIKTLAAELHRSGALQRPPAGGVRYAFNFKPPPQVDPTKWRGEEKIGLANKTLTFAEACRRNNQQEDDVIASWVRTFNKLKASGLSDEQAAMFVNSWMGGKSGPQSAGSGPAGATGVPNAARNNQA